MNTFTLVSALACLMLGFGLLGILTAGFVLTTKVIGSVRSMLRQLRHQWKSHTALLVLSVILIAWGLYGMYLVYFTK